MSQKYAYLDGSNLVLGLADRERRHGVFLFVVAFKALQDRGYSCVAFFDSHIEDLLRKKGFTRSEIEALGQIIRESKGAIVKTSYADDPLLTHAKMVSGYVVNHSDKYRTWTTQANVSLPTVIRVRRLGSRLFFTFEPDKNEKFQIDIPTEVRLFNITVPGNPLSKGDSMELRSEIELVPTDGFSLKGRLIVFALDASPSMWSPNCGANQTYDGRLKSEHLNEMLREAVGRFAISNARDSFYISVVSFAAEAAPVEVDGMKMMNVGDAKARIAGKKFNYIEGIKSYGGTDIAKALRISIDLVDSVLASTQNQQLHGEWHALIILITDGQHNAGNSSDVIDVARQAAVSHSTLAHGNIRLACVGIGKDCDANLLRTISSEAEAEELGRLKRAGLDGLLLGNNLVVLVNERSNKYGEVIRNFVDVVSHTV